MLLIDFFRGTRTLRVSPDERRAVFSRLAAMGIPAKRSRWTADGDILLTLYEADFRRYSAADEDSCPIPGTVSRYGIGVAAAWMKRRPGCAAGGLLAVLLLIVSALFVWRVDVICLDNADAAHPADLVDTEAVKERLREQGVGCGTFLPAFDSRHAEAQFLIGQTEVSWIAVNRRGTVLSVEVRPARAVREDITGKPHDEGDGMLTGTNLVADADGKVLRWELRDGMSVVAAEEMVTKGQVLATGIFESKDGDVRFSRVSGKVYADTLRRLSVTVPFEKEETVYTGERETRRTLVFFGHELPLPARRTLENTGEAGAENVTFLQIFRNFLGNAGFSADSCVIIEDETVLRLPGGVPLPIAVKTETRYGTETVVRRLTEAEARAYAERALDEQRAAMTDAVIRSEETGEVRTEDALTVTRDIFCIDNIAQVREYGIIKETGQHTGKELP